MQKQRKRPTNPYLKRKPTILNLVAAKVWENNDRLIRNIEADLQGLPLPFPPPKRTCPHCKKEIDE